MSHQYTPVASYHTSITVTDDGDLANDAEFNPPYQQCADNAAFCRGVIDPFINGGTITLPSTLTFSGADVQVDDGFNAGTITSFGTISALGALNVSGLTSCAALNASGAVVCEDNVTISGNLQVAGGSTLSGDLTCEGTATLDGAAIVNGALTANGNVTLGDSSSDQVIFKGESLLLAPMVPIFSGGVWGRAGISATLGVGTDHQTYEEGTQFIFWGTTTLTANASQSLLGSPGQPGDHILLTYNGTSFVLTFAFPGGVSISMGSTGTHWAYFVLLGGTWRQAAQG